MHNNDIRSRAEIRADMQQALKDNDAAHFEQAFSEMLGVIEADIRNEYNDRINDAAEERDSRVLTARGVRQLTGEERKYYQKLAEAMQSANPKQALANMDVVMPKTVIDSVFEDLHDNHELLSHINFRPTGGAVEMIINTHGEERAVWGKLCAEVVEEIASGFKKVDSTLLKLSAFIPVCKAMLVLGPEWLDRYVREILYEAYANGLEYGIVAGTGKDEPIGMIRQVGDDVVVTGGIYPKKNPITITDLSPKTIGTLLGYMASSPTGRSRAVRDVIFVVNPVDYFTKVMPATTVQAPDGTYRNDVLPYPMTIIQSGAVDVGEAVIGIPKYYFATAGTPINGNIDYDDSYHYLEDERIYMIKGYANGMALDNMAFHRLDISGLVPPVYRIQQVEIPDPSTTATLAVLSIGNLALTPAFAAATVEYEADTTNASDVITVVPSDSRATVAIKNGTAIVINGKAATWEDGENTVTITVTAEDGTTTKEYEVVVTADLE